MGVSANMQSNKASPKAVYERLVLSQVDDNFDVEKDLAFGPWCFIGKEECVPTWTELNFVDALETPELLGKAENITRKLTNKLVRVWGQKLNILHETNHSLIYWRFVLIAWLLTAVQGLWSRYVHAVAFVERYGEQQLVVELAPIELPLRPANFMEFQNNLRRSPRFDFWISSLVIRAVAPSNWQLKESSSWNNWNIAANASQTPELISNEQISRFGNIARSIMGRLSFDSVPGVTSAKIFFSIYLNLLPKNQNSNNFYDFGNDETSHDFTPKFMKLLNDFLQATLPHSFHEKYKKLEAQAASIRTVPGRLFIGNVMPSDDVRLLEYAHALEAGEKFMTVQHGGAYGTLKAITWAAEFEFPHHAFLTWGWKEQDDHKGNFIALPSPLLSKYKNKHKERNSTLSMIATRPDIRDVRLFGPRPSQWIANRRLKIPFIQNLDVSPKKNLVYFAYTRSVADLKDVPYLQQHFPDLDVRSGGLDTEILKGRLLLLDHPGTTLHIAMAANVPTICYWQPEAWPLARQAAPLFKAFEDCGILFTNPEEAACQVNLVWDNVSKWWESADIQEARLKWANQHARTHRLWWWQWMKVLARLQCAS